jgi:hypothetical protein
MKEGTPPAEMLELFATCMDCMSNKWESRAANAPTGSMERKACTDAAADFAKLRDAAVKLSSESSA